MSTVMENVVSVSAHATRVQKVLDELHYAAPHPAGWRVGHTSEGTLWIQHWQSLPCTDSGKPEHYTGFAFFVVEFPDTDNETVVAGFDSEFGAQTFLESDYLEDEREDRSVIVRPANGPFPKVQTGRKYFISEHAIVGEIVGTAFEAALKFEEHEARERFKYKGRTIYGPIETQHFEEPKK